MLFKPRLIEASSIWSNRILNSNFRIGILDCSLFTDAINLSFHATEKWHLSTIFIQLVVRKTQDWRRAVRFDPSRSSEVHDFRVIWKGLCNFLLVINSNLSSISHRFWDTTTYRLKIANFPYPTSVQPQTWKCSLCTRSLKFCVRRAKTLG